jgi:hypothetical protein
MAHKAGHGGGWQKRSQKHSSGGVYNKGKNNKGSCGKSKLRKSKCRKGGSNRPSFFQKLRDKKATKKYQQYRAKVEAEEQESVSAKKPEAQQKSKNPRFL